MSIQATAAQRSDFVSGKVRCIFLTGYVLGVFGVVCGTDVDSNVNRAPGGTFGYLARYGLCLPAVINELALGRCSHAGAVRRTIFAREGYTWGRVAKKDTLQQFDRDHRSAKLPADISGASGDGGYLQTHRWGR